MKIIKFRFEDKALNWRLEEMYLDTKLTLLVGASGVGKTQILKALMNLQKIAEGQSLNGVAWYLEFETLYKNHYIWEGEFETKDISMFLEDNDYDEDEENKPKILFEKLRQNTTEVVNRTTDKIIFNGQATIKLSQEKSVLDLLKEESLVRNATDAMQKLYFSDQSNSSGIAGRFGFSFLNANKIAKKYNTLNKIRESEFETSLKLFFLAKVDKKTFNNIKAKYIDIFPQVEDIKIAPLETRATDMPDFLKDYPFIQIKEKNVAKWITQERISSGMFRTLMQISELYLCAEGTVFLIDEFENSLGINCINEITQDILASERQLQFILTSHHPYIIDAISFANWKLVTRNASVIKTHNLDKFNIGKSRHSAFMQLIQLEEYQTGQEQL